MRLACDAKTGWSMTGLIQAVCYLGELGVDLPTWPIHPALFIVHCFVRALTDTRSGLTISAIIVYAEIDPSFPVLMVIYKRLLASWETPEATKSKRMLSLIMYQTRARFHGENTTEINQRMRILTT